MRKLLFCISAIYLLTLNVAAAQSLTLTGKVKADRSTNSADTAGIVGAAVMLRMNNDSTHVITKDGTFRFNNLKSGKGSLTITHLSYETYNLDIEIAPGRPSHVEVLMRESTTEIDQVEVLGEIPLISQRGDTLIINAAAVHTLEGDETREILKKIPGIEIDDDGKITAFGEDVDRVYMDGKMFGTDMNNILDHLRASDVDKIQVYDEYSDRNVFRQRREGDDKVRVLNVETKSKPVRLDDGAVSLGGGTDIGSTGSSTNQRFGMFGRVKSLSENYVFNFDATLSNINSFYGRFGSSGEGASNPANRYNNISAGVERLWKSKSQEIGNLSLDYSYNRNKAATDNISQRSYFPTEEYQVREEYDSSMMRSRSYGHNNLVSATLPNLFGAGVFFFSHNLGFDNSRSRSTNLSNYMGDSGPIITDVMSYTKGRSYDLRENFNWHLRNDSRFFGSLSGSFSTGRNTGDELRKDMYSDTTPDKNLVIDSKIRTNNFSIRTHAGYMLSDEKNTDISVHYGFIKNDSYSRRTALNESELLAGRIIDTTNTHDYTNKNMVHSVGLAYANYFEKYKLRLRIGVDYSLTIMDRDEKFPSLYRFDRNFNAFTPSFMLHQRKEDMGMRVLSYRTSVGTPSLEELRPQLVDTNPYSLRAGNPDLKQPYSHNINFTDLYIVGERKNTMSVMANLMFTSNPIVTRTQYFGEGTFLDKYSYYAPAQSSLTTSENGNYNYSTDIMITFGGLVKKIKGMVHTGLNFGHSNTISYVQNVATRTKNFMPSLNLSYISNFSEKLDIAVNSRNAYTYTISDNDYKNKYFSENLSGRFRWNQIFKHFYVEANYNASLLFGNNYNSSNYVQYLAAGMGAKLYKNQLDINFSVYDLLNKSRGFHTQTGPDYISYTWTESYGRYCMLNLSFKFNHSKSSGDSYRFMGPMRMGMPGGGGAVRMGMPMPGGGVVIIN